PDLDRTPEFLSPAADVQGMQPLMIGAINRIPGFGDYVDCPGYGINDWRPGNADLGRQIMVVFGNVGAGHRIAQIDVPYWSGFGGVVGIESIDAVMLCRYKDHACCALPRPGDFGCNQWLS